jgi:hypothetical protein
LTVVSANDFENCAPVAGSCKGRITVRITADGQPGSVLRWRLIDPSQAARPASEGPAGRAAASGAAAASGQAPVARLEASRVTAGGRVPGAPRPLANTIVLQGDILTGTFQDHELVYVIEVDFLTRPGTYDYQFRYTVEFD